MSNFSGLLGSVLILLVPRKLIRKETLIALLIPMCTSWLLIAYPSNAIAMIAAKFIQGLTGGLYLVIAQVYTTEAAHKSVGWLYMEQIPYQDA
jgi:predicted MFS family arabinose efflux permease